MKVNFLSGYQNTKKNGEDFALTPYLFLVNGQNYESKCLGIGICWGYYGFFIAFATNIPKGFPFFKKYN